jgi:hypothetical protein
LGSSPDYSSEEPSYQAVVNQMARPDTPAGYYEGSSFYPQDAVYLGEYASMNEYNVLSDRMEVNLLPHFNSPPAVDRTRRPGRGLAAIGVGLLLEELGGVPQKVEGISTEYANRVRRRQNGRDLDIVFSRYDVQRDPPDQTLMMHLRNKTQPSEFRSATAMALGIGGQRQRADDLKQVLDSVEPGQESVFGYGLLALALWGDADVLAYGQRLGQAATSVDPAKWIAAYGRQPLKLEELMARRAAAQALGLTGDPAAIPLLVAQWGRHPALDQEVARAIAWCSRPRSTAGADELTTAFSAALAKLITDKSTPRDLAASAAASLGMLHADTRSEMQLARVIDNSNFRARGWPLQNNGKMNNGSLQRQVLALGNPSYYLGMLAQGPTARSSPARAR